MLNSNYYTPDREDLFDGYECEVYFCNKVGNEIVSPAITYSPFQWSKEYVDNLKKVTSTYQYLREKDWENGKLNALLLTRIITDWSNTHSIIRTKYLTREDIEKEGWVYNGNNGGFPSFYKGNINTNYYQIRLVNEILEIADYGMKNPGRRNPLFFGKCKSVNEFRKLCKMLEI